MKTIVGLNLGSHDSSASAVTIKEGVITDTTIYLSERLSKKKHDGSFPLQSLKLLKQEYPILNPEVAMTFAGMIPDKSQDVVLEMFGLHHQKFISHHLAHAYSLWSQCPFEKALVVVSDGLGSQKPGTNEFETFSVYQMDQGQFELVETKWSSFEKVENSSLFISDSFGGLFASLSKVIFGDINSAGKIMGLSAYGTPSPINDPKIFIRELNGISNWQMACDLSASVQHYFEKQMLTHLERLKNLYPDYEDLILVGGCALNCLLNSKIKTHRRIFIPPFPNDEGVSLGAALAIANLKWKTTPYQDLNPYLGPKSSDANLGEDKVLEIFKDYSVEESGNVARLLADGKIIAWIQGRAEVGPRALGNRSILARPDRVGVKKYLNQHIKFREDFRPYGATILIEETSTYFEVTQDFQSPFMTFAPKVKEAFRERLGDIIHIDGSCRIQTLMRKQNPKFYDLIESFQKLTGLPILLNTSLNIMGQPILETIEDAYLFFKDSQVDYLVYGDYLIKNNRG